uniref:Uncharacterized protein n=1 Tax=Schlesneria paludicola TaxID=360056 RepID=A0A7C4QN10_9PLAN
MSYAFYVAAALNWGVAVALLGVGLDYLTSNTLKPHHHQMLDVPWEQLTDKTRLLMLTLMKGTGLVAVVTAVAMALLLVEPFRRQENWSRYALLIVAGTTLVPTLVGTFQVRAKAGPHAPWWPHVVMLCALGLAFGLTSDFQGPQARGESLPAQGAGGSPP